MTKSQIIQKLTEEIDKCEEYVKNSDGELEHAYDPMANGTYVDGILFALELLRK